MNPISDEFISRIFSHGQKLAQIFDIFKLLVESRTAQRASECLRAVHPSLFHASPSNRVLIHRFFLILWFLKSQGLSWLECSTSNVR